MEKHNFIVRNLGNDKAEILLYGDIGFWAEVTAKSIIEQIHAVEKNYTHINLRIHSPGGQVYDGLAMITAIQNSSAIIHGYIDGLAASMAAIVALSCDKVFMAKNARIMLHQSSSFMEGQSGDFRRQADMMDALNSDIAQLIADKTGKEKDWVSDNWLAEGKDRWFNGTEALEENLVDELVASVVKPSDENDIGKIAAHYNNQLLNSNYKEEDMKFKSLIVPLNKVSKIKLNDEATLDEVAVAIQNVVDANSELSGKLTKETAAKDKAVQELADAKVTNLKANAESMIETAVNVTKQITKEKGETLLKLASASQEGYDQVKALIALEKPYVPITNQLAGNAGGMELEASEEMSKLSYLELLKKHPDYITNLKANDMPAAKALYKKQYGVEPNW